MARRALRQQRQVQLFAVAAFALLAAGCLQSPSALAPTTRSAAPSDGDCLATVKGIDLQHTTIAELQRALSVGQITSVDLVDAYAARIAAFDSGGPKVNSVQGLSSTARAQAAALDAERLAGHMRGPLHGIPILLKDNVGTNDQPTTAGSIALANNIPPRDAGLTAKLRDAGAIVLGKTHLSEFANWVSLTMPNGYSSLGGQVVNAYTGGDPSGSSSGSGVAGSMAFATGTIGTETSGSILGPSDANSLVGVKPTVGLVSRAGVIPLAGHFDTPGPMVRNVYDAAAVLSAIAGPDPRDPATAESAKHLPPGGDYTANLTRGLTGVRLGYDPSYNDTVFLRALDDLKHAGAVLVPIQSNPNIDLVGLTELALIPNEFKAELNDYLANEAGKGLPVKDLTDIILFNQQHPDKVKYGQDLLIASDAQPGLGAPVTDIAAVPTIASSRAVVDLLFTRDQLDALVGPSLAYVASGAAAGYPTVIVPAGYNDKNPEGLSFFGQAWSEEHLLTYAFAYEQASHRREPPTTINPSLLEGVCGPAAAHAAPVAASFLPSELRG